MELKRPTEGEERDTVDRVTIIVTWRQYPYVMTAIDKLLRQISYVSAHAPKSGDFVGRNQSDLQIVSLTADCRSRSCD